MKTGNSSSATPAAHATATVPTDKELASALSALYEPADGDAFVARTRQLLPHRYACRIWLIALFAILWGSVLSIVFAFRHTIHETFKAFMHAITTFQLPSADVLLTALFFGGLFVFAVYESCDTASEYIELSYRRDRREGSDLFG